MIYKYPNHNTTICGDSERCARYTFPSENTFVEGDLKCGEGINRGMQFLWDNRITRSGDQPELNFQLCFDSAKAYLTNVRMRTPPPHHVADVPEKSLDNN